MENKKKYRGVNWGSILLFILIIGGILWMANKVQMHQQEISYSTFVKEVEAGNVTAADIRQNSAVPTGRCLLYTSPSPRDQPRSRMPSSA